jgi:hypothetical protein
MNVWLVVVPTTADTDSQEYRYLWIQGQSSGGLLSQLALFPQDLNLGSLTALATEFCFITRVTLRYTGGDWEISRVTDLTGNRVLTVGSPAGVFLSTVATDATLTGDGTTGNPLSVVGSVGGGGGNVDGGNASSTFALTIADGGGA